MKVNPAIIIYCLMLVMEMRSCAYAETKKDNHDKKTNHHKEDVRHCDEAQKEKERERLFFLKELIDEEYDGKENSAGEHSEYDSIMHKEAIFNHNK